MSSRRLLLSCLLLAACPPRTAPEPPPGGATSAVDDTPRTLPGPTTPEEDLAPPAPDDPDAPDEPGDVESGERSSAPKMSSTRGDNDLADTLAPRGGRATTPSRKAVNGGCEGGARRTGETWKVACNQCSCGDDGQSTCTAIACGPAPD